MTRPLRVLIGSLQVSETGSRGHLFPLIGLLQWLVRRGHHVTWLPTPAPLGEDDRRMLEAQGAHLLEPPPLPPGILKDVAELARLAADPETIWQCYDSFMVAPVKHMVDFMRARMRETRPDVVATDGMAYAPAIAARLEGIPQVGLCAGFKILGGKSLEGVYRGRFGPVLERRAELMSSCGLTADFRLFEMVSDAANVVFTVPEVADVLEIPPRTHAVGPPMPPGERGDEVPFPWDFLDGSRSLVYAAFGSVFTEATLDDIVPPLIEVTGRLGAQLVISSQALARRLPPAASHVRIVPYAPQLAVLARTATFVTHGGANSVTEGLTAGVPLVVIPLSSDQPLQARLVEELGAGIGLRREEVSEDRLAAILGRCLDPGGPVRRRARDLGERHRARDGGRRAAEILEEVAAAARDVTEVTERWARALAPERVRTDPQTLADYQRNVSALERRIRGVVFPTTTGEVQQVVRIAREARVPLYAFSTGRNWGMGSRLPVRDGAVLVDLGRMNRIHRIDARHGIAIVEPGVTQGQLARHLLDHGVDFHLNVTGSAAATSVLGNSLDRGTGFFEARHDGLSGLEVVLGTGEVMETGYGHFPGALATHVYPPGVGPSLDGLFFQSSVGIVTRAGVRLLPRPEHHALLSFSLRDADRFPDLVDLLNFLSRHGYVRSAVHVSNRPRSTSVIGGLLDRELELEIPDPARRRLQVEALLDQRMRAPWSATAAIQGSLPTMLEAYRQARTRLGSSGWATVGWSSQGKIRLEHRLARMLSWLPGRSLDDAWYRAVLPNFEHSLGLPSDAALHSIGWALGGEPERSVDLDRNRAGTLFVLPAVPFDGPALERATRRIEDRLRGAGFVPYITWNQVAPGALEGVVNIVFDREDPAACERARRATDRLSADLRADGILPYRLGIQAMEGFVDPNDPYWQVLERLKAVLDPDGILSPGRYSL